MNVSYFYLLIKIKSECSSFQAMLYSRNKESFKKSAIRIQHKGAHRHILNMVKEVVGLDQPRSQTSENKCSSNCQQTELGMAKGAGGFRQAGKEPIMCESLYSEGDRQKKRPKDLAIQHVIDYSIRSIDQNSKVGKAQKEYLALLESKIQALQEQLKSQEDRQIGESRQDPGILKSKTERLVRFYHRARNIIVLQSVQLLECKNIISELKTNPAEIRLRAINDAMTKSEEILEVYRMGLERGSPRKPNDQQIDEEELKDLCQYQEKTIEFLRKQVQPVNQFNEIRLLRHEINRVCTENQTLLQKIAKLSKEESKTLSSPVKKQQKEDILRLKSELSERQNELEKLQIQLDEVRMVLKEDKDQRNELLKEKTIMMDMLERSKFKNEELETNIVKLQLELDKCERELHELKIQRVKKFQNENIATTEQLCRELKAYPRYFKLLMSIISQYETKINQLQTQICNERQIKQKFRHWMSEVYHLLSSAHLQPQILQRHKDKLYNFDSKMDCSKIEKLLRQIRALSIGIDEREVKEMEAELDEYVVSLKSRNQVIKEVDCEDGSSVAVSDTFTDQDFDE